MDYKREHERVGLRKESSKMESPVLHVVIGRDEVGNPVLEVWSRNTEAIRKLIEENPHQAGLMG